MLAKISCFANAFPNWAEQEGAEASAAPLVLGDSQPLSLPLGLGLSGSWMEAGGSAKPLSPVL